MSGCWLHWEGRGGKDCGEQTAQFKEETAVAWAKAEHCRRRGGTKNVDVKDMDLAGPVDGLSSCCQEKELKEGSLV